MYLLYALRAHLLLILGLMLLLPPAAMAADLTGRVLDDRTGEPISGANVVLQDTRFGASTEADGRFEFRDVPGGTYILSASHVAYQVVKQRVETRSNERNLTLRLVPRYIEGQEVVFLETRAEQGRTPAAFSDISGTELRRSYTTQDIPPLLERIPSVYAYSESGNNIGYTHLKIRGFDQTRIGVTLNNIPLNDPEDGQVYWVDMPDLASNLADIQVQRGVGFSQYGSYSFGGAVNLITAMPSVESSGVEATFGAGSYNTRKWGISLNSGLVNNTYGFYGRFSRIQTDGYRDRSGVELWSYFLTGVRYGEHTTLRINVFGGPERTHASWDASAESALENNRRHNPIEYENTIDSFNQPHYEVHHEWRMSTNLRLDNTFFYIRGEGYYEQFKDGRDLVDFGYQPFQRDGNTVEETDLVNQKWVEKDHVGWIPSLKLDHGNGVLQAGADLQWYQGDHYGFVIWGDNLPVGTEARKQYYSYKGVVNRGGAFIRERYTVLPQKLYLTGDAELRYQAYSFEQEEAGNFTGDQLNQFEVDYLFFNPKAGVTYKPTAEIDVFASVGLSHRAPVNDEYWDVWDGPDDLGVDPLFATADTIRQGGQVVGVEWTDPMLDPERVLDIEVGSGYHRGPFRAKLNLYFMRFNNEIIPYGGADPDRGPLTDNAELALHRGVEIEGSYTPMHGWQGWAGLTLSQNTLQDYTIYEVVDWDTYEVGALDLSGNTIALFPSVMAQGGLGYRNPRFSAYVDARYVGKQYLDNTEDDDRAIDPYSLLGATVAYRLPMPRPYGTWEVKLRMNNLLDTEYETAGWYDAWVGENFYFVGADRNFFVSLTARF